MWVKVCPLHGDGAMPTRIPAHANVSTRALDVQEKRCPAWALAAPVLYLLACFAAIRAVVVDGSEVGVSALILAAGLVPAFAIPAVFDRRRARLELGDDALLIDGVAVRVVDARLERAERGTAVLHLMLRDGRTRSFVAPSYQEAQRLVATLPPVSAPAGALAVRA